MIWFTKYTTVEEKPDMLSDFPMWTYDPTPFTHIPRPTSAPEYFIDIIGVISAISGVEHIQTAARATPSLKRTIFVCDINNHEIRLDMWGECATRFKTDSIQSIGIKEPLIAIFVGTLPKTYKGQTSLSGSSACRWYINEDIPEINALHASLQQRYTPLKIVAPSAQDISMQSQQPAMEEKTIAELLELDLFDHKGVYFACTGQSSACHKDSVGGFLHANYATKRQYQVARFTDALTQTVRQQRQNLSITYRISLIGSDGTGEAEFVLFGKIGQQLTQNPLHEIVTATRVKQDVPNAIASVVSQKYWFVVSITEKSFLRKQTSFQVHRIATYFGRQLHSSLFHSAGTSSQ